MKIPNGDRLAKIKIAHIVPTLEEVTSKKEILIEMEDGTIGAYINEDYLYLNIKYKNMDAYLKDTYLTIDFIPEYDIVLTRIIKKTYKNVKKVYTFNL